MVSHSFTLPSHSLYSLGRDVQFRGKVALLVMSIHHVHLLAVVLQYVLCVMGPDYYGDYCSCGEGHMFQFNVINTAEIFSRRVLL